MIRSEISANAHSIRQYLMIVSSSTSEKLKTDLHLNDEELYMAIGWLVNEQSVFIYKNDNTLELTLEID